MAGEENGVVDQPTDVSDAQAEADFNAGFDNQETLTETPKPMEAEPAEEQPVVEVAPEPVYAKITQVQFEELMGKAVAADEIGKKLDTAFGTMGNLKQTIEKLQSATQSGHAVEVTEEDLTDLAAEYPELSGSMLKTFQKVLGKVKGTGSADPAAIEKIVLERVNGFKTQLLDSRLDEVVDGNWREEVNKPEWRDWFDKQKDDVKKLGESDSLTDASRLMRMYVKHKNTPAPAPVSSPAPAPISTRQRQLQASVNPKSSGGTPPGKTAEDEFNEGFNSR